MKTIFRFIIAAMAAISVFSSCQKELANETASSTTDGVRTISVQFDNSTKASLSGLTPTFTNNDKIRVSNTEKSEECTVTVSGTTATFTTTLSGALTAIYPEDAAVLSSDVADAPIATSNDFKVSATQDGTMEKAIIAKATVAEGGCTATFYGLTSLFVVTPPSGATSFTIKSLKQIGTDGQRSGTAKSINNEGVDDAAKCKITVDVPTGGTAYVSLVPGVNLTDLSFDAGATYGMKGIPMKDITAGKTNATAANTKYTIGNANNTWHPYVEIEMTENSVTKKYKWATMNIGATSSTDNGYYFAWGYAEGCVRSGSGWVLASSTTTAKQFNTTDFPYRDASSFQDAATANWGGSWRMPTKAEFDALKSKHRGFISSGYYFGDSESNQIFLPAAGFGNGSGFFANDYGRLGRYWSSSLSTGDSDYAIYLYFGSADTNTSNHIRYCGLSVRALSE